MAPLPNADQAIVAPEKISQYLLARDHPRGGPKAAFFESFGFSLDRWQVLRDALLLHARTAAVIDTFATPYGQNYEANGAITSPDGRNPIVLVIWMVRIGEDVPRFVTAIPSREPQL